MMNAVLSPMLRVTALAILVSGQMDAHCAKCEKIESDRAKEQAANPKPWTYYDEELGLHSKKETAQLDHPATVQDNKRSSSQDLATPKDKPPVNQLPSTNNVQIPAQNLAKAYSTIYTIFRTKNFLEALDNSFTLFVPTDKAIYSLPRETLLRLTRPEYAEHLASIVSNHVVGKLLLAKDFTPSGNNSVKAISGRNLSLSSRDGKLYVDNKEVIRSEASGQNGIIYVIDDVLVGHE